MNKTSYSRHRFPPDIIQHAVWLYARFTLNYRDVEDLLAERGLDISYETARRWFLKFGEPIARNLRSSRPSPNDIWHLDEMVIVIRGKPYFLWRALKLMRKLLKKQGFAPTQIVTDKLKPYHKAFRTLSLNADHIDNKRSNNWAENSHLPVRRRERKCNGSSHQDRLRDFSISSLPHTILSMFNAT